MAQETPIPNEGFTEFEANLLLGHILDELAKATGNYAAHLDGTLSIGDLLEEAIENLNNYNDLREN